MELQAEKDRDYMIREMRSISSLIGDAVDAISTAARKVVELMRAGWSIDELSEASGVCVTFIRSLSKVGYGEWDPRLVTMRCPAASFVQRLPLPAQVDVIDGSIDVVEISGSGPEIRKLNLSSLTLNQCRQVFFQSSVRTPEEQSSWLRDQREMAALQKAAASQPAKPYEIRRNVLHVTSPCSLTKEVLTSILSAMR